MGEILGRARICAARVRRCERRVVGVAGVVVEGRVAVAVRAVGAVRRADRGILVGPGVRLCVRSLLSACSVCECVTFLFSLARAVGVARVVLEAGVRVRMRRLFATFSACGDLNFRFVFVTVVWDSWVVAGVREKRLKAAGMREVTVTDAVLAGRSQVPIGASFGLGGGDLCVIFAYCFIFFSSEAVARFGSVG